MPLTVSPKTMETQATYQATPKQAPAESRPTVTPKTEYVTENLGKKVLVGNLGKEDTFKLSSDGKFLSFTFCAVEGEAQIWWTVSTELTDIKPILSKGRKLELTGVCNKKFDPAKPEVIHYNMRAYKIAFCK